MIVHTHATRANVATTLVSRDKPKIDKMNWNRCHNQYQNKCERNQCLICDVIHFSIFALIKTVVQNYNAEIDFRNSRISLTDLYNNHFRNSII